MTEQKAPLRSPAVNAAAHELACQMRSAIDAMELSLMGFGGLVDLPDQWGEPRHRPDIGVSLPTTTGQVYQVCDALAELTRIINSSEFLIFSRAAPPPSAPVESGQRGET